MALPGRVRWERWGGLVVLPSGGQGKASDSVALCSRVEGLSSATEGDLPGGVAREEGDGWKKLAALPGVAESF